MFIYILCMTANAVWTNSPNISFSELNDSRNSYEISTEDFQHINFPDAYDAQMFVSNSLTNNISEMRQVQPHELIGGGCVFDQRRIRLEESQLLNLPEEGAFIFTDLIAVGNSSYLVRNDHKIFEIEMVYSNGELHHLNQIAQTRDFQAFIQSDLSKKPQFFSDNGRIYTITETGAVSFAIGGFEFQYHAMQNITHLVDIHYCSKLKLLFVLAGQEIKVYNSELQYKYTITINNLYIIKVQLHGNTLFALDDRVGIHFIHVTVDDYELENFQIPLENSKSFIFRRNSFVVVAETSQNISFAIEILIDMESKSFYYNKFYLEDMILRDVQEILDLTVIIGFDVHKIIQTGIYNKFVDEEFDYDSDFMVPLLERVAVIQSPLQNRGGQDLFYLVGVTPHYMSVFLLLDHKPELVCNSQNEVQQSYRVIANQTLCSENPFTICQQQHFFNLTVNGVLIDSQSKLQAELFLILTLTILMLLLCCSILMCRRWKAIMESMQQSIEKIEKKKKYNNLNQNPQ